MLSHSCRVSEIKNKQSGKSPISFSNHATQILSSEEKVWYQTCNNIIRVYALNIEALGRLALLKAPEENHISMCTMKTHTETLSENLALLLQLCYD